jgi:regulatory protein
VHLRIIKSSQSRGLPEQVHGFFNLLTMEHTITALSVQKRNPQRVNIYLDGEFAFGLARIIAAWLKVGEILSDEKIAQLQAQDGYEKAYQHALRYLSYRPRTRSEIAKNLRDFDTPDEVIESILEKLAQSGMVNDAQFAQAWVENRSAFRPRSRRALTFELRRRGVDPNIIEQSIAVVDEDALAYEAARKQAGKLRGLDWQLYRQKMFGFLARRGFNYEVSAAVISRVWAELNNNSDNQEEEDK